MAMLVDDGVLVVDAAVDQVEDVAGDDGRERHPAPVLGEAVHAKDLGDDRGVDAEEEAVCHWSRLLVY